MSDDNTWIVKEFESWLGVTTSQEDEDENDQQEQNKYRHLQREFYLSQGGGELQ